jgi:hypothetical protein
MGFPTDAILTEELRPDSNLLDHRAWIGTLLKRQPRLIDRYVPSHLTCFNMAVKSIQIGQVWRHDSESQNYLVTKVYSEVFSQFAILRRADATAASGETTRVKIQKTSDGVSLPGYTFTQDSEEF